MSELPENSENLQKAVANDYLFASLVDEVCGQFLDWAATEYANATMRDERDLGAKAEELRRQLNKLALRPPERVERISSEIWRQRWCQYAPAQRMWAEKRLGKSVDALMSALVTAGKTIQRLECLLGKRNRQLGVMRAALKANS